MNADFLTTIAFGEGWFQCLEKVDAVSSPRFQGLEKF